MITFILLAIILSMALTLLKCICANTSYDRILTANVFGTQTVALIATLGFIENELMFLDIALIYALINFITTVGFLKYFKDKSFE